MTDGPIIPPGQEKTYERFHFAPAYRVGDMLYVSGVIGTNEKGRAPEDASEEFTNTFANLGSTLEAAGSSLDGIVEMTSFHVDMDNTLGAFIAAKDVAISEPYPAWTAIGCTGLAIPGARVEVKVTAKVV
ncbi:MAG: enamine deaminase RidA (YjgF/YER057c/UK114 family) [Acidimicrobiales bacterium]|jgi:enamine deaminase RidA (YjgF/YER057c/UK114 family)